MCGEGRYGGSCGGVEEVSLSVREYSLGRTKLRRVCIDLVRL